jgi:hypothetical protein
MTEKEKELTQEEIEKRTADKLKADEAEHQKVRDQHDADSEKRKAEEKAEEKAREQHEAKRAKEAMQAAHAAAPEQAPPKPTTKGK